MNFSDTRDYDDHHSQHSGRSDRAEGWKEDEYGQTRSNKDGRDRRNGDDYAYERGDRNYRFDTLSDRDRCNLYNCHFTDAFVCTII